MDADFDIRALAADIKAAQDEVRQVEPFTSRHPSFDLPAGYEVAHLVHAARMAEGALPVGRKIGFTNPDMWALYGVGEPIWAYVYDRTRQPMYPPIQPGELVSTGTITTAQPVRAGETWNTTLSGIGLPGLTLAFTD